MFHLVDISIHAPLAGRDFMQWDYIGHVSFISIHAPLAGRDGSLRDAWTILPIISIHAPLAGRDSKNAQTSSYIFVITDNL